MGNANILLSIVIVNYNGERLLSNCISSILKYADCKHEIIVVDNASIDNSLGLLKKQFPSVIIIENKKNVGFASGNNIGVSKSKGKYALLLNNDTILFSPLTQIINKFKINPKIGVIGCTLKFENRAIQPSFGYEHTPVRIILSWLMSSKFTWIPKIFKRSETNTKRYYKKEKKVNWVSGAALFTKTDLWKRLNGMDEKYFMYIEDVDYCRRVGDLGFEIIYSPEVEIIHLERGGIKQMNNNSFLYTVNSYLIYTKKYFSKTSIIFVRIGLSIIFLLRSVYFYLIGLLQKSNNNREQSKAYFKTGIRLISFNL